MYILVNNVPINIFNAYISNIMQFDIEVSENLIRNFYSESQYTNRTMYRMYTCALKNKSLIVKKLNKEEYQKYSAEEIRDCYECIQTNKNPGSFLWHDTRGVGAIRYYKIDYDKDNFYFYIDDNSNGKTILSEPYPTKESAEEARNKLFITINRVVASLRKVEI